MTAGSTGMNYQAPVTGRGTGGSNAYAVLAGLICLPFAFLGPNVVMGIYAALVLSIGMSLLQRPGEPPILMFVFLYQWTQAAAGPLYGNLLGFELNDLARNLGQHELANFLELTGVLCLAIGMRLAVGQTEFNLGARIKTFVHNRPLGFWFRIYLAASLFGALCATFAYSAGGLQQPLLSLAQIKWAAYILLTFATFSSPGRSRSIWIAVTLFEFALSLGGFFSTFKDIFFYAVLGLLGSGFRLRPAGIVIIGFFAVILLSLGIVWSSVKVDYRDFVNGGSSEQAVTVGYSERINYLGKLVGELDGPALSDGLDKFAHRIMYFEYFGAAIGNVPQNVPHTNGALWGRAALSSFMPRLIFTDKAPVHDSELTREYTGIRVTSYEVGTSISMGYMAEAYIDFGPYFMFVLILLLGGGLGLVHRWLLSRPGRDGVVGAALSTFTLMPASAIETSALKLIPAVLLCVIACLIILKFIAPLVWGVQRSPTLGRPNPQLLDA